MQTLAKLLVPVATLLFTMPLHAQAVRLQRGQPFSYAVSGFSWYETYVDAHAPNYGAPNAALWPWVWVPATYSHSLSTGGASNIEVWEFAHSRHGHPNNHDWTFAVYYYDIDTGIWSWDNNFDQDYSIPKDGGNIQ